MEFIKIIFIFVIRAVISFMFQLSKLILYKSMLRSEGKEPKIYKLGGNDWKKVKEKGSIVC